MVVTSSHQGELLHRAALPWPCAWVLGHEGQGVSPTLAAKAQPGACASPSRAAKSR
jgi:TrmH family RNA methyltransferase